MLDFGLDFGLDFVRMRAFVAKIGWFFWTWILVRQEVHILGIGTGTRYRKRARPGPNPLQPHPKNGRRCSPLTAKPTDEGDTLL